MMFVYVVIFIINLLLPLVFIYFITKLLGKDHKRKANVMIRRDSGGIHSEEIIGCDFAGNEIYIKFLHLASDQAQIKLDLHLSEDVKLQLSESHTQLKRPHKAGGLAIETLHDAKLYRITYNGWMMCGDDRHVDVKFNLIWTSASHPMQLAQSSEQFGCLHGEIHSHALDLHRTIRTPTLRRSVYDLADGCDEALLFLVDEYGAALSLTVNNTAKLCEGSMMRADGQHDIVKVFNALPDLTKPMVRACFQLNDKMVSFKIEQQRASINDVQAKSTRQFNNFTKFEPVNAPNNLPSLSNSNATFLSFNDPQCQNVSLVGGKACGLAHLTGQQQDFHIPSGVVITVNAYIQQVERSVFVQRAIEHIEQTVFGNNDVKLLQNACNACVEAFQQEDLHVDLSVFLENLSSDKLYAIRSSSVDEDLDDISAAGQNITHLAVKANPADITAAIKSCWASLYAFTSVEYRRQHGLPIKSLMAVVVQEMIPADSAGVLFTTHPISGNCAEMLITANYGLGESVVSGSSNVDTLIIAKSYNKEVTVRDVTVGKKHNKMMMGDDGVYSANLDGDTIESCSLSHEEALQVAKTGLHLEDYFQHPCDIEFAFCKGKLYLLQCRAITSLQSWTDYELEHELDAPIMCDKGVYTTANIKEVLPGAAAALTNTTIMYYLNNNSAHNPDLIHIPKFIQTFSHHNFIEYINVFLHVVPKQIQLENIAADLAVLGHQIINDDFLHIAEQRFGPYSSKRSFYLGYLMVQCIMRAQKDCDKARDLCNQFKYIVDSQTASEAYQTINDNLLLCEQIAHAHSRVSRASSSLQVLMLTILGGKSSHFNNDHYHDIGLLSHCNNVLSAQIPVRLMRIAQIIRETTQCNEFIQMENAANGVVWLRDHIPDAARALDEFLIDYGHRASSEFDLGMKSWRDQPDIIIKMLQSNCKVDYQPPSPPASSDNVVSQLKTPLGRVPKFMIKILLNKNRNAVRRREDTKSSLIKSVDLLRNNYRSLAAKLHALQRIPDVNLIYHFTHNELQQLITSHSTKLVTKALARQRKQPTWNAYTFPEIIYGIPTPIKHEFHIDSTAYEIHGTPVCGGDVTARCCAIKSIADIDQLQPGDILVTYSTDICWSPYFPTLGGVVTELGGLISHGAVVAREYGLPCLVGAENALQHFRTGDLVTLSATKGALIKHQ